MSAATIEITLATAANSIEVGFTTPPGIDLSARVIALENPGVIFVVDDYQATPEFYGVVMMADAKTVTLPKAGLDIVGRVWSITLGVAGSLTIATDAGDSFPAPTSETETSALIQTRGSTASFRCTSPDTWCLI